MLSRYAILLILRPELLEGKKYVSIENSARRLLKSSLNREDRKIMLRYRK